MNSWQDWTDALNHAASHGGRDPGSVRWVVDQMPSASIPMPNQVDWVNLMFSINPMATPGRVRIKGTLLEFLACTGGLGLYDSREKNERASKAMIQAGDDIVRRGGKPTQRMVECALSIGLLNLDGPGRLDAALRWGGKSVWNPQATLACCAGRSGWDVEGSKACWERLVAEGALSAPGLNFVGCSAMDHPIARAALARDVASVKRAIDSGVGLGWTDPETGVTLWHLAASISIPMAKALAPALVLAAPHLASVQAVGDASWPGQANAERIDVARAGMAPLHCAVGSVNPPAFAAIMSCKPPADPVDAKGDTPLTLLSRRWGAKAQARTEPMARALLEAGADPAHRDAKGRTAAQNMVQKGPLGALEALLAIRPEDVGGEDGVAKVAFEKLAARGAEGLSQAERSAVLVSAGVVAPAKRKTRAL